MKLQLAGWPSRRRSVAGFADQAGRLTAVYLDDQGRSVAALTINAPATLARCRPLIARRATIDEIVDHIRLTLVRHDQLVIDSHTWLADRKIPRSFEEQPPG
jgi:hypothetical protein